MFDPPPTPAIWNKRCIPFFNGMNLLLTKWLDYMNRRWCNCEISARRAIFLKKIVTTEPPNINSVWLGGYISYRFHKHLIELYHRILIYEFLQNSHVRNVYNQLRHGALYRSQVNRATRSTSGRAIIIAS